MVISTGECVILSEAANGGQMMEMCETKYFGERLVKAVEEGKVPMERIDDAAVRMCVPFWHFTEADQRRFPKGSRMQKTY